MTETWAGYENPYTGELAETGRFNAVVEPDGLIEQDSDGNFEDLLFHVPIFFYEIINPIDVYRPLEDVRDGLRERLKETGESTESEVFRVLRDFQTTELAGG